MAPPLTPFPSRATRRRALLIGAALFVSYAWFYEGGGWNQNSRFDLVRALVERHSVRIDEYADNTGDRGRVGRHYISDKAPGASLTAAPAVALVRAGMRAAHRQVDDRPALDVLAYVATLTAAAAPAALAGTSTLLVASLAGADDLGATVVALAAGLGSPLWAYATILYGHALAAGSLSAAFLCANLAGDVRRERAYGLGVGLLAGWAVVAEYPAAVPAVMLAGLALWRAREAGGSIPCVMAGITTGAAMTAVVLSIYNEAVAGHMAFVTYQNLEGYEEMKKGLFGIGVPNLHVVRELLVGSFRGLLPLAPVFALVPLGVWRWIRRPNDWRVPAIVAAGIIASYFAIASGYHYWMAGWTYGPRYIGASLGLAAFLLTPLWIEARRGVRALIVVLVCVGAANSLAAVATSPQAPVTQSRPLSALFWPRLLDGDLAVNWESIDDLRPPLESTGSLDARGVPRAAWNLGLQAGLRRDWSLLPLGALWLIVAWVWRRLDSRSASR
jgi:uncharacterized membrane protein (GlpM family)